MADKTVTAEKGMMETLRNLWPYMWPADRPDLKARVVWATLFLVVAKLLTLLIPYFFKWATDALDGDLSWRTAAASLPAGPGRCWSSPTMWRASSRPASTSCATRCSPASASMRCASSPTAPSCTCTNCRCASISSGAPAACRASSSAASRASRSIVRFTILNRADDPRIRASPRLIFAFAYGWIYVAVVAVTVALYVWFTVEASDWRIHIRRDMNTVRHRRQHQGDRTRCSTSRRSNISATRTWRPSASTAPWRATRRPPPRSGPRSAG